MPELVEVSFYETEDSDAERYYRAREVDEILNSRDDWRPMSEAPRDGSCVLILVRSGIVFRAAFSRGFWRSVFPDVEICVHESDVRGFRDLNLPEGVE